MTVAAPFQPPPSLWDPRGFAVGVLANRDLEARGLRLRQFRWQYGAEHREHPYDRHRELAGRFIPLDGVLDGFYPGDHAGCRCLIEPVYTDETGRALPRQASPSTALAKRQPSVVGPFRNDAPPPPTPPRGGIT